MGRSLTFPFPPKRIISLVPSQTELLFDLGLNEEVVGITKFCVHPREQWKIKTRIGGTKQFHFDKIAALQPDLIIGNKEENDKGHIEQLEKDYPVWMSDIKTIEDALAMIRDIGEITEKATKAVALANQINDSFASLKKSTSSHPPTKAAFFIWKNPYMVAATGTFINEMMQAAGFVNVFADKTRYPEVTLEEVAKRQPEVLLLSSEPFPFTEKHFPDFQTHCPAAAISLVDGEMFSWYGSRMLKAVAYFKSQRLNVICK